MIFTDKSGRERYLNEKNPHILEVYETGAKPNSIAIVMSTDPQKPRNYEFVSSEEKAKVMKELTGIVFEVVKEEVKPEPVPEPEPTPEPEMPKDHISEHIQKKEAKKRQPKKKIADAV